MQLTNNEQLLMYRRRKKLTQRQFAEELGTSSIQISLWERGLSSNPLPTGFCVKDKDLLPYEQCFLARRRKGRTIIETAERVNVSRLTVIKMEQGVWDCSRLVKHFNL